MVDSGVRQAAEVPAGLYKVKPEDFTVCELLPFQPEGQGEHIYLNVRQRGHHTLDIQRDLAKLAKVPRHYVGYGGLKDRRAVTSQWFSVYLPGDSGPDFSQLESDSLKLEQQTRHRRKLRIGAHRANRFSIVLRQVRGDTAEYEQRLRKIVQCGFPNYFGEQRFGRNESNLRSADQLGPVRKGRLSNTQAMVLSASRAFLFNCVLARRQQLGNWDQAIAGDLINLNGSNSYFGPVTEIDSLQQRLAMLEIHPTGPMFGCDDAEVALEAAVIEEEVVREYPAPMEVVCRLQAKSARRALRANVADLEWHWPGPGTLQLDFTLTRGVYATSLLAALGHFEQGSPNMTASEDATAQQR